MNKVAWIIFAAVIIVIFGGLIIYSRLNSPTADIGSVDTGSVIAASDKNGNIADHTLGTKDSKVVLIEYGDFQCPSCGGAHPNIKSITEEYKDKILFIFRNLPLTSIHPNAKAAAAAVEAAGLQDKYWEMHNLIFESQSEWSSLDTTGRTEAFQQYAGQLGLDKEKFLADLDSASVKQKISFDEAVFASLNLDKSTPTFVLNGAKVSAEVASDAVQGSGSQLRDLIDQAL